jgi:hypothetical protein
MKKEQAEDGSFYDITEHGDIFCEKCGGCNKFYVNRVGYDTHITCVRCNARILVHEG